MRRATPAENMMVLKARLYERMSPAERAEMDEAIEILKVAERSEPESLPSLLKFTVELHSDAMTPNIQALILKQPHGGYRLTNGKGCGHWNLVKTFKCSATLDELRDGLDTRDATHGEGSK